ncbi:MAG TPA: HAMP domain-containing sensor histidine kinase, partial [Xanthobacteraceae bacterium]|nr:HAMP domain-containing sensor histidine kinase [Xanthobacteraceae bacterium]
MAGASLPSAKQCAMNYDSIAQLAALLRTERANCLSDWRRQVRQLPSARHLDVPTLNDHMPGLLDVLSRELEFDSKLTIPAAHAEGSAEAHGLQRLQDAFDVEEVVAEYNILRACIHDLADRNGVRLQGSAFHIVNRVFDGAIGVAVRAYATQQAAEVLRRREEYLAFVAHDLRTPLSAISLAGRVLEQHLRSTEPATEVGRMLRALSRNVQQLERLVNKVLEENTNLKTEIGTKLERREMELWALVEALIHDLHPLAGTASTLLINEVPDDLYVYADANLLRRILQNLIANAIKHTPRGEIIIGARKRDGGNEVECMVRDNGSGIPQAFLEKIFEKGETDSEGEGGMGLGLAIVKTFVEA